MASSSGLLSKGIKISYAEWSSTTRPTTFTELDDLQSIPSLGGKPDRVEVTTLADGNHRYLNGIKEFGELEFKFLFDGASTSSYAILRNLEAQKKKVAIRIELDDALTTGAGTHHGTQFTFDSNVSVSLDSAEINTALTFTCTAALLSDVEYTAAA